MGSSKVQTGSTILAGDEISSWGENPLFHVTRLCLTFLQRLFENAPDRSQLRWNADRQLTQIVITDEYPLHSEVLNKRPAVVTMRSPVAFAGLTMEQKMSENLRTGERVHSDMISGHMTFNCMSRVKVEAEQLAWLVARHLWILHRVFMRAGFHKMGERVQIQATSPAGAIIAGDTEGEILNVPVVSPYHFQWTERITPLNLTLLGEIEASMIAEMKPPATKTYTVPMQGTAVRPEIEVQRGVVRPPHIRGRPINTTPVPSSQPTDGGIATELLIEE